MCNSKCKKVEKCSCANGGCKCDKSNKSKKSKKTTKTREVRRQEHKIQKLRTELSIIGKFRAQLFDTVFGPSGGRLAPIDRVFISQQLSTLDSYSTILNNRLTWETVRTRTARGEYLKADDTDLMKFIFGDAAEIAKKGYNMCTSCSCKGSKKHKETAEETKDVIDLPEINGIELSSQGLPASVSNNGSVELNN